MTESEVSKRLKSMSEADRGLLLEKMLHKAVRLEDFTKKRKEAGDELARKAQTMSSEIIAMIEGKLESLQAENAKLANEVEMLKEQVHIARQIEDKMAVYEREITRLQEVVETEKAKAALVVKEKAEVEKKLATMQEHWEKYVAGGR